MLTRYPSGVTAPFFFNDPSGPRTACIDTGALGHRGVAALMSQRWFSIELPKAAWKNSSASVKRLASAPSGSLVAS